MLWGLCVTILGFLTSVSDGVTRTQHDAIVLLLCWVNRNLLSVVFAIISKLLRSKTGCLDLTLTPQKPTFDFQVVIPQRQTYGLANSCPQHLMQLHSLIAIPRKPKMDWCLTAGAHNSWHP